MPGGIEFDTEKGRFSGAADAGGKSTFRIEISFGEQRPVVVSPIFMVDAAGGQAAQAVKKYSVSELNAMKIGTVDLNVESVYELFGGDGGLSEENFVKCLLAMKKAASITMATMIPPIT